MWYFSAGEGDGNTGGSDETFEDRCVNGGEEGDVQVIQVYLETSVGIGLVVIIMIIWVMVLHVATELFLNSNRLSP